MDLDGDTIRCRWATSSESLGAYRGRGNFGSLTLDEENCIITYDGSKDNASDGVKPIALQIEDFDSDGNMISSMPVQFLATVWTPSNSNFANRNLISHGPGVPFQHDVSAFHEGHDDHDDNDESGRKRRAGTQPAYCDAFPELADPSPQAGAVLDVKAGKTLFITVKAKTDNGSITRFSFNSPLGMTCTDVDFEGESNCEFTPTQGQMGQVHNFCFVAEDSAGLSTERRCITINAGSQLPSSQLPPVEIFLMISILDSRNVSWENYGCAGRGNMDAYKPTFGLPVDQMDKALNLRKHCIQCASTAFNTTYQPYQYHQEEFFCGKF